ncbi:carboxyltransferase domain-containing protein [Streptomyces sp. NPDC000987]|uniref:5-oxoprolinase subunit B family protein n=1 Tax=unclassified Streptomyces TaxID=2593676 RepID=UPI00331EB741
MRHETPLVRVLSDGYVTVEYSDVIDLGDNVRIQGTAKLLTDMDVPGVIEVVPHLRSLAVVFDDTEVDERYLLAAVREAVAGAEEVDRVTSRLFRLPVWYDDPFSRATAEHFKVENNLEYVARINGLSPEQAIEHHTGTDFWVAAVGFVPGCFWAVALHQSLALTAPKYLQPRDRTPSRTVALAGLTTTIYPYPGPGGYQCIGRCAVDVYRSRPDDSGLFGEDGVLVRAGDRHRYYAVDALEYEAIRQQVHAGTYRYDITEEELSVSDLLSHANDKPI